jgi:hypothetical protein
LTQDLDPGSRFSHVQDSPLRIGTQAEALRRPWDGQPSSAFASCQPRKSWKEHFGFRNQLPQRMWLRNSDSDRCGIMYIYAWSQSYDRELQRRE